MARPVHTFRRICEAACGLEVDDNRIVRILPNRRHRVTRGFACPKGLRFNEPEDSPDRLRTPLKRGPDGWREISWDRALREIGD